MDTLCRNRAELINSNHILSCDKDIMEDYHHLLLTMKVSIPKV